MSSKEEQLPNFPEGYYSTPDDSCPVSKKEDKGENDKEMRLLKLRQELDHLFSQISEALRGTIELEKEIVKLKENYERIREKKSPSGFKRLAREAVELLKEIINPDGMQKKRIKRYEAERDFRRTEKGLITRDACILRKIARLNGIIAEIEKLTSAEQVEKKNK